MRIRRFSGVAHPKRETVTHAEMKKALDAALARRGDRVMTPRDIAQSDFRRGQHIRDGVKQKGAKA